MANSKRYRVIVADPPWPIKRTVFSVASGKTRTGAVAHYPLMPMDEIKDYELPPMHKDSALFLWTIGTFLPQAFDVMDAWGFKYTGASFAWGKMTNDLSHPTMGMGSRIRMVHELCLLGVRGHPKVQARNVRSLILARRHGHSVKPEKVYAEIERLYKGPYAEIFARRARFGWDCYGEEREL